MFLRAPDNETPGTSSFCEAASAHVSEGPLVERSAYTEQ